MPRIRGKVATTATTEVAVNGTTYTEPAAASTFSVKSSSANDTNTAGTGARKITVKYYLLDANNVVTGPFTETVTLNGTTAVASTTTDTTKTILLESMEVLTGGSGASMPAGTVSIYPSADGSGTAIASIAIGDRVTFLAHHFVPSGLRHFITDITASNSDDAIYNSRLSIRWLDYSTTSAVEREANGELTVAGGSQYNLISATPVPQKSVLPIVIVGPARVQYYLTPQTTNNQTTRMNIGYSDQL